MAIGTFPGMLQDGNHASRPAATAVGSGALYACSDHGLIYQSDGSSWSTWATLGGSVAAEDVPFTPAGTIAATDVQAAIEEVASEAVGGGSDPITDIFGAADTEYDGAGIAALTALGPPTAEDGTNGSYYVRHVAAASRIVGRYTTPPSAPYTVIAKVSDFFARDNNYNRIGCLFVAEATPGGIINVSVTHDTTWKVGATYWSTPTSPSANLTGTAHSVTLHAVPVYYAIVVNNAADDIDCLISFGGRVWYERAVAYNPAFTIASIGVGLAVQGDAQAASIDWMRVWNSALTFPAVPNF